MSSKSLCSSSRTQSRRKILDIYPRVEGEEFTKPQNDDDTLTFLIDLGYKGPLHKYTSILIIRGRENQDVKICHTIDSPKLSSTTTSNNTSLSPTSNIKHYYTIKDDGIVSDSVRVLLDVHQETVDDYEESKPEPKPIKKKTASKRVVKKKVTISTYDNIIPDPDISLELGKSIDLAKSKEEEAAKQVHATYARIMTESVPESAKKKTGSRSSRKAADITQALKESKKTSKRQLSTRGLKEDQLNDEEKDDKEGDADDEGNDHISDTQDTDDEDGETKSDEDEIYKKGDTKMSDVTKEDAEMTEETNNDSKKAALPPTIGTVKDTTDAKITSLLYIKIQSKVLHIQSPSTLKVPVFMISEPLVLIPIQETPLAAHVTTLPPPSISTIPPAPLQQTTTPIPSPPITTDTLTITTAILKSDTLLAIQLRVINLEKDVSELKKIHHSVKSLATLKSQVLMVVQQYLGSKIGDDLQKGKKTKRRRTKESESSKNPSTTKETPKGKAPSKCSKTSKSASTNEPIEEPIAEVVMDDAGEDVVCDDDQPQDTSEPKTAKTPNLEWIRSHSTISCPLLLTSLSHLTIVAEYFFNNDLEYLKSLDPERTYTTSIRKTKAAWFEIVGIKYMVPMLWSTIKHAYDKDAAKGIKH
nr:hypothetical protein [Tanacetum cinerariifolium]